MQVDVLLEALPLSDLLGLPSFYGFMPRGGASDQYLGHLVRRLFDG